MEAVESNIVSYAKVGADARTAADAEHAVDLLDFRRRQVLAGRTERKRPGGRARRATGGGGRPTARSRTSR